MLDTYQVSYALFSSDFAHELLKADPNGDLRMGLPTNVARELDRLIAGRRPLQAISMLELWCFLGERLLRDTDTASMASSLEVRVPFLDHEVVEAASALDDVERFEPLGRKQVLREIALGDLDRAMFERPKSGFVLPIARWARDVLRNEMTAAFDDRIRPIHQKNTRSVPVVVEYAAADAIAGRSTPANATARSMRKEKRII